MARRSTHEVCRFLADVEHETFNGYGSIQDAQSDPDAAAVLSGDYGGTILLTAPLRLLQCSMSTLETLGSDLDAVTWMSGDLIIATVAIEKHQSEPASSAATAVD